MIDTQGLRREMRRELRAARTAAAAAFIPDAQPDPWTAAFQAAWAAGAYSDEAQEIADTVEAVHSASPAQPEEAPLGSRIPSYLELSPKEHVVIINQTTEYEGQRWNTLVGEIRLPTKELAEEVMRWIR